MLPFRSRCLGRTDKKTTQDVKGFNLGEFFFELTQEGVDLPSSGKGSWFMTPMEWGYQSWCKCMILRNFLYNSAWSLGWQYNDTCQGGLTFLIPLSALLKMMIFVFPKVGCVSSLDGKSIKRFLFCNFCCTAKFHQKLNGTLPTDP